ADAPPSPPVPRAWRAARVDLHRPGVRPDRRDDRRRARLDKRPLLRLPGVDRRRLPVWIGVRIRDRRRHLRDHHRDVRAAGSVQPLQGRGTSVKTGTQFAIGERRFITYGIGLLAWLVALIWIFPVAWTALTSFKTEQDAAAQTLHQGLSFGRYSDVAHSTPGTLSLQTA